MKTCVVCGVSKPLEEFYKRPGREHRRPDCRTCQTLYTRAWAKKNPDRVKRIMRKHDLKRAFGLTPEQHAQMLENQSGVCAACGTPFPGWGTKAPYVDHDHKTGAVRGLLCHNCNFALGYAKDNPVILRSLARYLERHNVH